MICNLLRQEYRLICSCNQSSEYSWHQKCLLVPHITYCDQMCHTNASVGSTSIPCSLSLVQTLLKLQTHLLECDPIAPCPVKILTCFVSKMLQLKKKLTLVAISSQYKVLKYLYKVGKQTDKKNKTPQVFPQSELPLFPPAVRGGSWAPK